MRPAARAPPPPRPAAPSAPAAGGAAPAPSGSAAPADDVVVEVTAANFEAMVLNAPVAVVLDCYADWCEPCRTLTPRLEAVVRSARGMIRLAKLNVDAEAEIAAQLGVRSLPTVLGIVGGKMVDRFMGVVPDPQLQAFFTKLAGAAEAAGMLRPGAAGGGGDPVAALTASIRDAGAAVDAGNTEAALVELPRVVAALAMLRERVQGALREEAAAAAAKSGGEPRVVRDDVGPLANVDMLSARTYAVLIRAALCAAQAAVDGGAGAPAGPAPDVPALYRQAREYADLLRGRYKAQTKDAEVARALATVDLAAGAETAAAALAPLRAAVAAAPTDPDARFALAEALMAAGNHAPAVDHLLAILKAAGPAWREGTARTTLLKLFDTLGPAHPLTASGRKALSKVLFR